jgi:hypothetical protein
VGEPGFPHAQIGVPRFELGTSPTRTERATRLRHTPSQHRLAARSKKVRDRVRARFGALADREMAAVGNRPQWRAQAARVFEGVADGKLTVPRAPENEARTADALEVLPGILSDERVAGTSGVGVPRRTGEKRLRHLRRKGGRVGRAPAPEDERPQQRRVHDKSAVRRDPLSRLYETGDCKRVPCAAQARGDSGRSHQHERSNQLGPPDREPEGDRPAEGVSDDMRRASGLVLEEQGETLGVRVQSRLPGKRLRPPVSGQLGHEQAPAGQEQRRQSDPVRRRSAKPMHQHERLALARNEVTKILGEALLEARELDLCIRHRSRLFFETMNSSGRQDP